jgi:hypothetical protein
MIKLELELDQVNQVLDALAKRPFEEVHELITNIRQQGIPQIKDKPVESANDSELV